MLKIAVPNKGSLRALRHAGSSASPATAQRTDSKQLTKTDTDNEVGSSYLAPRDIALYVGEGTLDVGITGRDLLLEGLRGERVDPVSGSAAAGSASPPVPATAAAGARLAGSGSRRRTSGGALVPGRPGHRRGGRGLTAWSRPASSSGWRTSSPTSWRPAAPAQRGPGGLRRRHLESEAVLITRTGDAAALETFTRRLQGVLVARPT